MRYGVVRRQSLLDESASEEAQILDYRAQQYQIFPLLAWAYSCHFAGAQLIKLYHDLQARPRQGPAGSSGPL